ncbi:uncharacterized protein Z519_11935 [Cladophialophora bantiana CBS 173.52]|uniref:Carrier domain-containing protein n=1 Tax=Cladophialophora bantiana (strain ATCC 10958 / CBS 173.52 / CDC B-1940 / NIH 8579) TaxID=1442370 RepID=A0A0D2H9Q7_CLAB1|nr:uncharacterized protein Z519_11935 [Cladophialophora bantiana CBS 173.52]KIW87610.1 hypothetical protein Z519_11935 [Cladophialophora bantiana CBS 173.52]
MAQVAVPTAILEAEVASLPLPRLLLNLVSDRASTEPNKIWGSIPISSQTTGAGYEDISYRRFNYAIDRAAWWMHNVIGPHRLRPFEPLAYLGPPDTRYIVFSLAAIKAGFQMLYLSPRNSDEAQYAVMKEADCHKWLCATEIKTKVEALVENRPPKTLNANSGQTESWNDTLTVVPGQTGLLKDEPTPSFSYNKTIEEARGEPLVMLHTSSTTGLPKLIPLTQGYGFHEDLIQHYPKEDELDVLTRKPFDGDCRLFLAMPLFHAGGVLLGLLKSLYHDIVMVFQPPAVPLSASMVDGILRHGKCDGTVIPPFLVEEMLGIPEYFDTLTSLKFVQFGSGPLSKYCGDTLLTRQKSCPHFIGTTEVGLIPLVELDDPELEWQYFHFHRWSGAEMRPIDDSAGLYELFIKKIGVNVPGIQPVFELFPHLTEWPTRDIYTQHPHKPYLWRTCGRADDIAKAHTAITGALIVGQGRFQPALLLEVKGIDVDKENEKKDLLQAIWPTIKAANKASPKHGQLTKSLTLFSSPKKPFLRTPKLSVRRKPTADLYSEEIDELYRRIEGEVANLDRGDLPEETDLRDLSSVQNFVQCLVGNVTGWIDEPSLDTDLFMLGMDSLHVVRIVRAVRAAMKDAMSLSQIAELTSNIIYNNPTIDSLSQALNDIVQAHIGDQTTEIIDRWTHGWGYQSATLGNGLERQTSQNTTSEAHGVVGKKTWTVILTGSTGSLGSHILENLLHHPPVSQVICLNRSADAAAKWKQTIISRKLSTELADPGRVQFLRTTNLGAPRLGLEENSYQYLLQSVTHVILNAWPVNFNLSVSSFEKTHIASIRRFTDFSSSSSKRAHIVFVSSLSSITSGGLKQSVPEKIIQDNSMPSHMGYAESKYIAERILDAATASSRGRIPTTSLRVGQIAGPVPNVDRGGDIKAKLEVWNVQEWFPSLIISSNTVRALPTTLGRMEYIDWIPVNVLANIVIELLQFDNEEIEHQKSSEGGTSHLTSRVYHLSNCAVVTWQQDILPIVQHFLAIDKVVPLVEWIELVGSSSESAGDINTAANPAAKILPFYRSLVLRRDETLAARPKYLTEQTQKASPTLREVGPVRAEWVYRCLSDLDLNLKVKSR